MTRRLSAAAAAVAAMIGCAAAPGPAPAQDAFESALGETVPQDQPVALIADSIEYDSTTGVVTASGNVEVFYGERTLTAETIIYDSEAETIRATGDIVLRDPTGTTVYADLAELDIELRDGLVRGARGILGESVRLSAVEARRVDGRYNALSRAVYSPCDVCQEDPTPLWRIRARRVIHDEEANVIHYENATFDVFGVPVAWLPYFRHPDPTVDRASGFLVPEVRQSGNYGFGLRVPYYIVIDEQSDLTVEPFFTTNDGVVGFAEYRRAFDAGRFSLGGSVTKTDFTGESAFQGHVDSSGLFTLNELDKGAVWGWDINATSDDAYLRYFDISDNDRLTSEVFLRNYFETGFYELSGLYFQSLRDNEPTGPIPRVLPAFEARREYAEPWLGGEFGIFANTQTLFRNVGDDTVRLSLGADWEREVITPIGVALRGFAELRGDLFFVNDSPNFTDETTLRLAPLAGVEARFPLIWETGTGAHVIQPIAQAIVAPHGGNGPDFANEDSQQVEFDETNLFDTSRFSGLDRVEEGTRFNVGLQYEHVTDIGLRVDASLGRVFRLTESDEFGAGTGLAGQRSDWVGAWSVGYDPYVQIRQRMRVDDDFNVNRNEVFADLTLGPVSLGAGYVFLDDDPLSGTPENREEVTTRIGAQLTPEWGISGFMQRDLEEKEFVEIGGAVSFANECCAVDVFLRRRFTDSEDTPASTSVGVQVRLLTLGTLERRAGLFEAGSFTRPRTRDVGPSAQGPNSDFGDR